MEYGLFCQSPNSDEDEVANLEGVQEKPRRWVPHSHGNRKKSTLVDLTNKCGAFIGLGATSKPPPLA